MLRHGPLRWGLWLKKLSAMGRDSNGGYGNRKDTKLAHAVVPGARDIMDAVAEGGTV